jgi:hypothetical protein
MTVSGVPNIRVILREADDENLLVDVPNLTVKVIQDSSYNVNTTQPVTVTFFSGSYNRFADVALLAYTASYVQSAANAVSSSYALTSSYAINAGSDGFPFSGSAVITGSLIVSQSGITVTGSVNITDNLTVEGIISAEKLLVSSSIIYESGSTKFGDSPEDTHQFTGSVLVQGPISASSGITGSFKGDGSQLTGLVTDLRISGSTGSDTLNLLTDNLLITGSKGIAVAVTNNTVTIDVPAGLTSSLYGTASVAEGIHIVSAGIYTTGSDSFIVPTPSGGFSIVTSASYALTASYAANGGGGGASDWNSITGKPAGLVSSSVQINTGSFSGSFTGTITSASYAVTSSFATTSSFSVSSSRATTSSFAITSSFTTTASYAANADLFDGLNSTVFATTGSNTFSGNQIVTGSFSVSSTASFNGPTTITDSVMGLTNSSSLVLTSGSSINVVSPGSITGSVIANALIIPTTAPASPQTGSIYFSGSFIYVYTGTQYRSASLA